MKNLAVILLLLTLLSCSRHRRAAEVFPAMLFNDTETIAYEGILPTESGQEVMVELNLIPASPGMDSYYKLNEALYSQDDQNSFAMSTTSRGTYAVLHGSPGQNIIRIIDRTMIESLQRGNLFSYKDRVTRDLYLKSKGNHELVLIDDGLKEVNPRYTLRRRSDLLTIEGYFTLYSDTAEYFERNTRKQWPVARFGHYDEAVKNYNSLAREKHEGVYLKALSYTVRQLDRNGSEIDAIVFKKILLMDSAMVQ